MRRSLAVSALALSIVGLGASPALADGGGEWVPVPEDYWAATEIAACGDTVTIEGGDVREAEQRVTTHPDGTVVTEYRGAGTLDLTRHSDGAMIDELDISGVGSQTFTPDEAEGTGTVVTILFGKSLLFPLPDPIDQAAHEASGLPDLAYFTDPEESATIEAVIHLETGELRSVDYVEVPEDVTDLCTWFDRGNDHHDSDDGDDDHDDDHDDHDDHDGDDGHDDDDHDRDDH